MGVYQTRIFVPSSESDEGWAETLLGRVLRPLVQRYAASLEWFWFSRYGALSDDLEDCDLGAIPVEFKRPRPDGNGFVHRSLRFRYAIIGGLQSEFESHARELIELGGYRISDFRTYDFVADTGSDRFLGIEHRQPGRAEQRARLVTRFYLASSQLVLDALAGPDECGRFRMEENDDLLQNPRGSSFQSLHHLFCNITGVPTDVYVYQKTGADVIGFGTYLSQPLAPSGGWDHSTAYSIWF